MPDISTPSHATDPHAPRAGSELGVNKDIPPRPEIPPELKAFARRWLDETADTPEYKDACRQYEDDLRILHPGEERRKKKDPKIRRNRRDDRDVDVARVFRSAQQTLAMVCPYDFGVRWVEDEQVPPPDGMFTREPKNINLRQFAHTVSNMSTRYGREVQLPRVIRSWVFQAIQFRVGILKVGFSRDFYSDPLSNARPSDEQEAIARLHYLGERLLRGEISQKSAEAEEIKRLVKGVMASGIIEVWQGLMATTVPLTRFRMDSRVKSAEEILSARWMAEDFLMTRDEIETRWPFTMHEDGTWSGVHPQDFSALTAYSSKGEKINQEQREQMKKERIKRSGQDSGKDNADELYLVREVHSRIEGSMFWIMEGLDYPIDTVIPTRRGRRWFPYHILGLNPREGTWYSLSDTELAGPVQSRMNRKLGDAEKSRWLSMGRGIYDTTVNDGTEALKLSKIDPGKMAGINLGGRNIRDLVMWLQSPHDEKWFNTLQDEADLRFMLRLPEQQMGVTDGKTTATAINTANAGSQIAASDKQMLVQLGIEDVYDDIGQVLVQEVRPDEVVKECGQYAFWPQVYDERTAAQLEAEVHQRVNQQVVQEVEQLEMRGLLSGQPVQLDQQQLDQRIHELTEQQMTQRFGLPEPLSREGLYRRLRVSVKVSLNNNMDRQNRIQNISMLLEKLAGLGLQPGQINLEPIARLIASLMGEEDEIEPIFKPDPNALIGMLDQIAKTDPSAISPGGAQVLANLGMLAARYVAMQGAPAGGAPGGDAPSPQPQQPSRN